MRLAEAVIQFYEDFDGFVEWLMKMKEAGVLKDVEIGERAVALKGSVGGLDGVTTGVTSEADPLNILVMLGFAFFGEFWVFMPDVEDAFKKVKGWWRERIRRSKGEK